MTNCLSVFISNKHSHCYYFLPEMKCSHVCAIFKKGYVTASYVKDKRVPKQNTAYTKNFIFLDIPIKSEGNPLTLNISVVRYRYPAE